MIRSASRSRLPGEEGIWIFIAGDLVMFSLFFLTFMYYRDGQATTFNESQVHLNQALGALNTFLMLTSSWFVATAVHAARRGERNAPPACFMLAFACGLAFCVVKVLEYREKFAAGITLQTNDFFMFYFMFTGIHFLHVLLGMGVLAFLTRYSMTSLIDEPRIRNLESGASFWHLVDLLWIVLFALLYLVK